MSARSAGVHGADAANNEVLLAKLRDVPDAQRSARFLVTEPGFVQTGRGFAEFAHDEKSASQSPRPSVARTRRAVALDRRLIGYGAQSANVNASVKSCRPRSRRRDSNTASTPSRL